MKILILTSVNPVISADLYTKISSTLNQDNLEFISYPFFATMKSQIEGQEYLPNLFAMMKAVVRPEMKEKLFKKEHTIVIGNSYREQEFDFILTFQYDEEVVFDSYIETLKEDKDYSKFKELVDLEYLYSPVDSAVNLPTIEHAILFIKEAIKKDENKNKTKQ